jgi:hypothetical protein
MKTLVILSLLFLLICGSPAAEPDETSALRDRVCSGYWFHWSEKWGLK